MPINQEKFIIGKESKQKDNGSSTKDFEDDVINELLSKVHRQVKLSI